LQSQNHQQVIIRLSVNGLRVVHGQLDTVWPYWNLFDFTPEGRPDRVTPPQKFRSEFLEKNYLNKE